MTEAPIMPRRRRVYVSPVGNGQGRDGSAAHPFSTLGEAIAHVASPPAPGSITATPELRELEIVSLSAPGSEVTTDLAHRYEFVVDPLAADEASANHEATSACPDLPSALQKVARLHKEGKVELEPGESLRVLVKDVFVATPTERRRKRTETIAKYVFMGMTFVIAVPLVLILGHLLYKAYPVLTWSFITQSPRNQNTGGGIWLPLVGTFYLVFFSLMVAAPIGILAGVYLNEYARDNWFARIINLAVVNLAGVPSIVHALFGVGAFVLFLEMKRSVMAASCTLGIMTLPVIITTTKQALASVPMSFREACWNMGASRWQTIRTIVLPNSISGILTGVILQVSRAAGETAPILFTGAAFSMFPNTKGWHYFFPYSLRDECMALSYHLYVVLTQVNPPSKAAIESGQSMPMESLQYGTAVVLIGMVLLVNSLAIVSRVYLRSRKKW